MNGLRRWSLAVSVVVIALLASFSLRYCESRPENPWNQMLAKAAELPARTVEGRLSKLPYAPPPQMSGGKLTAALVELQAASARVITAQTASLHERGVAALLRGRLDESLALLEKAAANEPRNAAIWSDLAVARTDAADRNAEPHHLIDALAAASRAIHESPSSPEARFNQSVILEKLGLNRAAIRSYAEFLASQPATPWADEARVRAGKLRRPSRDAIWKSRVPVLEAAARGNDRAAVQRLVVEFPQEARTHGEAVTLSRWGAAMQESPTDLRVAAAIGDALVELTGEALLHDAVQAIAKATPLQRKALANAHHTYMQAGMLYSERKVKEALALFEDVEAGFVTGRSPMAHMVRYYIAACHHDLNANAEAAQILGAIVRNLPSDYKALHAQIHWEMARAHTRAGRIYEAIDAYREAQVTFERLREENNAITMRNSIAAMEAVLGRRAAAWRLRHDVLRRIGATGDRFNLQRTVDAAARTEALDERWDNALALFTLATDFELRVNPRLYASSLAWRALAAHHLRFPVIARNDIAAARAAVGRLSADSFRERAQAEIVLIEATIARADDPGKAIRLLDQYIALCREHRNVFLLPEALLERSRAHRMLRHNEAAESDLREAVGHLDARAGGAEALRNAYFHTATTAVRELVDLVDRRSAAEAFAILDRARAAPYPQRAHASPTARTPVLAYLALDDELLIFINDGRGVRSIRKPVSATRLAMLSEAFVNALARDAMTTSDVELGKLLLDSALDNAAARRITIVPDVILHNIPFAALRLGNDKRLIEVCEVVVAPAATFASGVNASRPANPRLTAVGNPAFDHLRFSLPTLPAADAEVRAVGKLYQNATILWGSEATTPHMLAALPSTDILHLATHAVVVGSDPSRSHLLLAPSAGTTGAFYLHEIERGDHRLQLVILAGCETALAITGRRNIGTLSTAFLAAGAANALGTIWSIDDNASVDVMKMFHRELSRTPTPATALRMVQMNLMRSDDPRLRRTSVWSAFQLYGSGSWR